MFDFDTMGDASLIAEPAVLQRAKPASVYFRAGKRAFDILFSLILLPVLCVAVVLLALANIVANRGAIFFLQSRMGKDCLPFVAIKFRTMNSAGPTRGVDEPLEKVRITPLGAFLRRTRIDELPQIINVLRGQMSLIGPRPDYYEHARQYLREVPGYRERHIVLPGISGLAQTEVGYAEGLSQTRRKVQADLHYIANRSFRLEAWIVWRTLQTVFAGAGR